MSNSESVSPFLCNITWERRLSRGPSNELPLIIPGSPEEFNIIVQFIEEKIDKTDLRNLDWFTIQSIMCTCAVVGYKKLFCEAIEVCYPDVSDISTEIFESLPCNYDYNGLYEHIVDRLLDQVDLYATGQIVLRSRDGGR